jgi:hypothetical protein
MTDAYQGFETAAAKLLGAIRSATGPSSFLPSTPVVVPTSAGPILLDARTGWELPVIRAGAAKVVTLPPPKKRCAIAEKT